MFNLSPPPGRGGGAGSLASRVVKGGAPPAGSFVIVCLGEMVEQKEMLQCCHEQGCFCIVQCTVSKKVGPRALNFSLGSSSILLETFFETPCCGDLWEGNPLLRLEGSTPA